MYEDFVKLADADKERVFGQLESVFELVKSDTEADATTVVAQLKDVLATFEASAKTAADTSGVQKSSDLGA